MNKSVNIKENQFSMKNIATASAVCQVVVGGVSRLLKVKAAAGQ